MLVTDTQCWWVLLAGRGEDMSLFAPSAWRTPQGVRHEKTGTCLRPTLIAAEPLSLSPPFLVLLLLRLLPPLDMARIFATLFVQFAVVVLDVWVPAKIFLLSHYRSAFHTFLILVNLLLFFFFFLLVGEARMTYI